MKIIGHRGARGEAPENTLGASSIYVIWESVLSSLMYGSSRITVLLLFMMITF